MRAIGQAREWAREPGRHVGVGRRTRLAALSLLSVAALLWLVWLLANAYVDWAWQAQLGYGRVFLTQLVVRVVLFVLGALVAWLVLAGNLALARRLVLPPSNRSRGSHDELWEFLAQVNARLTQRGQRTRRLERWLAWGSLLLALVLGWRLSDQVEAILRWLFGGAFGVQDPVFGRDVGVYVFALPVMRGILGWLGVLAVAVALAMLALHLSAIADEHQFDLRRARGLRAAFSALPDRPRAHLAVLALVLAALAACGHQVTLADVVFSTRGRAGDIGFPGFVDARVQPLVSWAMTLATLGTGVLLAYGIRRGSRRLVVRPLVAYTAALLLGLLIPFLVQALVVGPNELDVERPFLAQHIVLTRQAYGVDAVQAAAPPTDDALASSSETLSAIPLWSRLALRSSLDQLQAGRPFYTFPGVHLDRYSVDGQQRFLLLAAREMSWAGLPSRSWLNVHLQYTHGYGVVAATASGVSATGEPDWLSAGAMRGDLALDRPEIYFGEAPAPYAVVRAAEPELELARGDQTLAAPYAGQGVAIGSPLARLAFAAAFGDPNLLFSRAVSSRSLVLYHRQVLDRVSRLAPFVDFDPDVYPVLADGHLYWVADGLSLTPDYPATFRLTAGSRGQQTGYARLSVRAVVDAYDGRTALYAVDPEDPILRAYQAIYPDLFQPLDRMPAAIRSHLHYPRSLLALQAAVLGRFHITDPAVFYDGRDAWRTTDEKFESRLDTGPYFAPLMLPGDPRPDLYLLQPFAPLDPSSQRQNLTAILLGRMDAAGRPRAALQAYPLEPAVPGPMQVDRRIDQDPDISSQIGLWQRAGTPVIRGQLLTLPLGPTPLYVESVYLQRGVRPVMPQLQRVIVSDGSRVVMETSLDAALQRLRALRAP